MQLVCQISMKGARVRDGQTMSHREIHGETSRGTERDKYQWPDRNK